MKIERRYCVKIRGGELLRGGIIGIVDLVDIVEKHGSRWFDGSGFGWILKNPKPLPFQRMDGRLNLFEVSLPQGT